jgi:hypothetical protein
LRKNLFLGGRGVFYNNLQQKIGNICNWKLKRHLVSFDGESITIFALFLLSTTSLQDENASNIRM